MLLMLFVIDLFLCPRSGFLCDLYRLTISFYFEMLSLEMCYLPCKARLLPSKVCCLSSKVCRAAHFSLVTLPPPLFCLFEQVTPDISYWPAIFIEPPLTLGPHAGFKSVNLFKQNSNLKYIQCFISSLCSW